MGLMFVILFCSAARTAESSPEQRAQVQVLQEEVRLANSDVNEIASIHTEIRKDISEVLQCIEMLFFSENRTILTYTFTITLQSF